MDSEDKTSLTLLPSSWTNYEYISTDYKQSLVFSSDTLKKWSGPIPTKEGTYFILLDKLLPSYICIHIDKIEEINVIRISKAE